MVIKFHRPLTEWRCSMSPSGIVEALLRKQIYIYIENLSGNHEKLSKHIIITYPMDAQRLFVHFRRHEPEMFITNNYCSNEYNKVTEKDVLVLGGNQTSCVTDYERKNIWLRTTPLNTLPKLTKIIAWIDENTISLYHVLCREYRSSLRP